MSHVVKAIETRYKGYRFRSRLEARWAVFFDQAEIAYEYELEGFKLPSGAAYLPDFFLPAFGLHVEVKPGQPTKFTINRFRPESSEPFASVEVFK